MNATIDAGGRSMEGKVAVVTGASRGIGAAVARAFSSAGAAVVVAARNESDLDRLAVALRDAGGRVLPVPTDVTDDGAVERLLERTLSQYGRVDAACNSAAGGGHPPTPLADVPVSALESAIAVNLRSLFMLMKQEIPAMAGGNGGAIVNMSSTAGLQAVGGLAAYVCTKHGMEGLTKVAALDYAEAGIRVNAVAPGPILTDTLHRAGIDAQRAVAETLPVRRIGRPDDVAAAVVWLCSDAAAFVTGATIVVDGGKLAGTPPFRMARTAATGVRTQEADR